MRFNKSAPSYGHRLRHFRTNGNQIRRTGSACPTGGDTYTFDRNNRMTQATISGGSSTTYTYNGAGVRTKKVVGTATTTYYQDGSGSLPRVAADENAGVWNFYVYGSGLIGKVGSDLVARYYHYDGTGHVRAMTDQSGAVVERYDYDAFGSLRNTPTGVANDRRFTGEQYDAETGYTYLRARYYDQALGRFISKDSFPSAVQDPQTLNRYAYVGNNPVNRVDPSGKFGWLAAAAVAGAAAGLFSLGADALAGRDPDFQNAFASAAGTFVAGATFGLMAPAVAGGLAVGAASRVTLGLGYAALGAEAEGLGRMIEIGLDDKPDYGEGIMPQMISGAAAGPTGQFLGEWASETLDDAGGWFAAGAKLVRPGVESGLTWAGEAFENLWED